MMFALIAMVDRRTHGSMDVQGWPLLIKANSENEAVGAAYKSMEISYPASDGWRHQVKATSKVYDVRPLASADLEGSSPTRDESEAEPVSQ